MPTKILFVQGDITDMAVDAIVNAANTDLTMDAGVAGAIRRKAGERIQEECERLAPIRLGEAVVTTGVTLKALFVIHAASMRPGEKATAESLRLATHANWFGGYYQEPKNFLVVFAVDPDSYLNLYDSDFVFGGQAREAFFRERDGRLGT